MTKSEEYYTNLTRKHKEKRKRVEEKTIRGIERGVISGRVFSGERSDGTKFTHYKLFGSKGYVPYSTRVLIEKIEKRFEECDVLGLPKRAYVNSSAGGLVVKNQHLRRLLKKRPTWKYNGNFIYES